MTVIVDENNHVQIILTEWKEKFGSTSSIQLMTRDDVNEKNVCWKHQRFWRYSTSLNAKQLNYNHKLWLIITLHPHPLILMDLAKMQKPKAPHSANNNFFGNGSSGWQYKRLWWLTLISRFFFQWGTNVRQT